VLACVRRLHVLYSTLHFYSCLSYFVVDPPAPPQLYTLSLHDALPISVRRSARRMTMAVCGGNGSGNDSGDSEPQSAGSRTKQFRSEEHTSELQSRENLVCRLLLEKKKKRKTKNNHTTQPLA